MHGRSNLSPVAQAMGMTGDLRPAAGAGKSENKLTRGTVLHSRVLVPRPFVRCSLRLLSRLRIAPPFPALLRVSQECSLVLSKPSLAELLRPFRHRGRLFPGLKNLIACRNIEQLGRLRAFFDVVQRGSAIRVLPLDHKLQ